MKEVTISTPMSVEDYIAFEERADVRHEYIKGQLIPLRGTTLAHNNICINLVLLLRSLLKKGSFKIQQENVKVQISSKDDYTYPDVVVTLDPRDFEQQYILKYPSVIFEVMSKSSRVEDGADKFIRYKNIESLQNYILVDSEKILVEVRTKQETGDWISETYLPSDTRFPIPALAVELEIAGVYEGVISL